MQDLGTSLFFLGLACVFIAAVISAITLFWQMLTKKQASPKYHNVLLWMQFVSVLCLLVGLGVCSF